MTISASSAYAFGEVLHKPHSLNIPLSEGWGFYAILLGSAAAAAALVLLPNAPLTYIVLIVNVIATLAMPPALLFLVLLVNDREIIGAHANGVWANVAAIAVTVGLVAVGLVWGILTVFPHLLSGH
jgi:Mn2+/Fe2+ NRAMP family transporter